jgi:addiction module HigA family antidote
VITSFADQATDDIYNGRNTKAARKIDRRLWSIVVRKLDILNAATGLADLRSPGNQLEKLKADLTGCWSIRVNDQYRIVFRYDGGNAFDVDAAIFIDSRAEHSRTAREIFMAMPKDRIATHPGEVLREEYIKPLGLVQSSLARELGISTNRLNELIRGKRGVTADTALRLAGRFKTSPEFWMNLQSVYELTEARAAMAVSSQ